MAIWTSEFFASPTGYEIGGNISWVNQIISVCRASGNFTNEEKIRHELIVAHEYVHYYQLISTLDGMSWFFRSIEWTDKLRIAAQGFSGKLELPVIQSRNPQFAQAISEFIDVMADEKLFMEGKASVFFDRFETPTSRYGKEDERILFYPIDNRHLYEGFARINDLFVSDFYLDWNETVAFYRLLQHEQIEYDWVLLLGMPFLLTSCLIDLALMRPVSRWWQCDCRDVLPGWRFIKARELVLKNHLKLESPAKAREFQESICHSLKWKTPAELASEILPYAENVKKSMTFDPQVHDIESFSPEVRHSLGDTLLQRMREGKFSQTNIAYIVDLLEQRINDSSYERFICPGAFMPELTTKYSPPVIVSTDGLHSTGIASVEVGVNLSHAVKMDVCRQMMTSRGLSCPIARLSGFSLPGGCPQDDTCPGRIPRPDKRTPECTLNEIFRTLFDHRLSEILYAKQ